MGRLPVSSTQEKPSALPQTASWEPDFSLSCQSYFQGRADFLMFLFFPPLSTWSNSLNLHLNSHVRAPPSQRSLAPCPFKCWHGPGIGLEFPIAFWPGYSNLLAIGLFQGRSHHSAQRFPYFLKHSRPPCSHSLPILQVVLIPFWKIFWQRG